MLGLFLSEVILFAAAGLLGFALGWRLYAAFAARRRQADEQIVAQLRQTLTDAWVRRAKSP